MLPAANLNYNNFKIATVASLVVAAILIVLSIWHGKNEFFLILNTDLGKAGDYFFQYFTHLGDGAFWLAWLIWILAKKQKSVLPLILTSLIFQTLITQLLKQVIFPDVLRPSEAIKDNSFIHYVEGVTLHSLNSFPSGHTGTAFTFVLLIALTSNGKSLMLPALILALLVGYSRIYLGQHFPLDVGGGIIAAAISVSLALPIQRRFEARSLKNERTNTRASINRSLP